MALTEYDLLKEEIIVSVGKSEKHSHLIGLLKEIFQDEINSPRKFERIASITGLIQILEDRDALSAENVLPLRKIVNNLTNKENLVKMIDTFEISHEPSPLLNYYNTNISCSTNKEKNKGFISTSPAMSDKKKERIFETIIEEIGCFWRDLARNLQLQESLIDDIEMNNRTLSSKASKVLEKYDRKADPQRWFNVLCKALEDSRRKELSNTVKNISDMNI